MPLLTRMVGTPLTIDIGPGAVAGLAPLLADHRISSGGHVAVVVGPGLGEEIAAEVGPQLANRGGRVFTAPIGTVEWVEVDDHADLAKAREVACRC